MEDDMKERETNEAPEDYVCYSQSATIRRQHHLICDLRERVDELSAALNAAHADCLEARKACDEWAEQDKETARQMLIAMAETRQAQAEAAARLKQMLAQADIDRNAIKEWERALSEAVDLLRPPVRDIGAKEFVKAFDSRRGAPATPVQHGECSEPLHCGCPADGSPHTVDCPTVLGDMARRAAAPPAIVDRTSMEYVLSEVIARRAAQDRKHGGQAHDDTHTPGEWLAFVREFTARAHCAWLEDLGYEDRLLDVAALAVAAIQSSRRKRKS